jgi:hypothetical protein
MPYRITKVTYCNQSNLLKDVPNPLIWGDGTSFDARECRHWAQGWQARLEVFRAS